MIPVQVKKSRVQLKHQIHEIEKVISTKLSADWNWQVVKTYIQGLGTSEGNFSQIGMWKLKNKLMPKEMDPPMAKVDKLGNLITAPEALKTLYLQTLWKDSDIEKSRLTTLVIIGRKLNYGK